MNCSCSKRWFCLAEKSSSISNTSSSISTPIDDVSLRDYCETSLDDIVHLHGILTMDKLSIHSMKRTKTTGSIGKKRRQKKRRGRRRRRKCCLSQLCSSTKESKKDVTFTKQILAPIVTLKDLISTSFSMSSSMSFASETRTVTSTRRPPVANSTPSFSCKSLSFEPTLSIISTPKPHLVHSFTSLSNYRLKTQENKHQYSLEEEIHNEECIYCANENSCSSKQQIDLNNSNADRISLQSIKLFHAIEMYLSSSNSSHELLEFSSMSSEQHLTSQEESKYLSRCEINQILYAIHSDIDDEEERNEILDSLAVSLRQVAEEIPVVLDEDESEEQVVVAAAAVNDAPEPPPPGLGQILVRAVMYDIVMKLFSFYLFVLMCYGH